MRCNAFHVVLLIVLACTSGCAPQVQWHGYLFDPVHNDARQRGAPTLVYFRSWYLPECTEFENKVLTDADVIAATRTCRNANIDFDWNKTLGEKWGVRQAPAVVLLNAKGELLSMLQGTITARALTAMLEVNLGLAAPKEATSQPAAPLREDLASQPE